MLLEGKQGEQHVRVSKAWIKGKTWIPDISRNMECLTALYRLRSTTIIILHEQETQCLKITGVRHQSLFHPGTTTPPFGMLLLCLSTGGQKLGGTEQLVEFSSGEVSCCVFVLHTTASDTGNAIHVVPWQQLCLRSQKGASLWVSQQVLSVC